ncbi:bifunctional histidinol-phosphatase/imidazoleglycerol-phosphate dehydratase HisB [Legionella sp. km772]|uniref:bifunctional histidinol-phosphatase/imidazoleglycerol-phosphate dehydratase HisB n=1 Tax=Legionella sp. km772 TaxID=2498111 RepID=UPI000F8EDBA8|nr:bifunctional histidinol-phosphatase/imidazoleglycerol-phosphate dehydratase HisB [Legionella sp. km772]RUR12386.1 bifunctional histidinol-phosphatase/imidazoleglycerol-phosphate dehydratase HisB [Legionella sp. km772]
MQRILFIDRDGTLVEEPYDFQVDSLEKIKLVPNVIPSLLQLKKAGFQLVMVSNQNGIGTSSFPEPQFRRCHEFIIELFASQGIEFNPIFICPHLPENNCSCRKPKTGLLDQFMKENVVDKNYSWVIGDRETDKELASNLGVQFVPISPVHTWADIVQAILKKLRSTRVVRVTKETDITLELNLDCDQHSTIKTPLAFFDHMLEQVAKHAGFDLKLDAKGDIEVDDHHLVEDVALALGEALKLALGDKRGINRYGFTLPMDESLATIALDLSGRSFCQFTGAFTREFVGGMATEMVPHFFNSLANSLSASIHLSVTGNNHHHMIEACFKALGRALRQACKRSDDYLPSTKGSL